MPTYTVGASTSVVLVDTSVLGPNDSAIVLLSSLMPPGRNVSIRDSLGYLSSPQSIVVSTTQGILFSDGTSSISVSQPFATLTVTSRDASTWNIVNTFGFPLYDTVANVQSLAASTIVGTGIVTSGSVNTSSMFATALTIQSTAAVLGPVFASTLVIGTQTTPPYPGYSAYVQGSARVSSNVVMNGDLSVGGIVQFGSTVAIAGGLGVGGNLTAGGNMTIAGNFTTVGGGSINCQTLQSQSSVNIAGAVTITSNVTIQSNLTIGATLTAASLNASTVTINTAAGGYLQLNSGPILQTRTDILPGTVVASWNSPIYTPFVSSGTIQTSGNAQVGTLEVLGTISAPTISQFLLGSAQIQNSAGSLVTDSISVNSLTLSNSLSLNSLQIYTLFTSNLTVDGSIQSANPAAYISSATLATSSLTTNSVSTGTLVAGVIQTPAIQVSSLTIYTTLTGGPGFTTMNIPGVTIDNSEGTLTTSSMFTNTIQTSSFSLTSGILYANPSLTIVASNTYINALTTSSIATSTLTTSTLSAAKLTIGSTPTGTNPNFIYSSSPSPSTNVTVTGGPGDYLSPYFLSNVIPAGQDPLIPYTTTITFAADYQSSPPPPGLLVAYTASLYWAGETQSILQVAPGLGGPTLYGLYAQDQTISGTLPISTFQITASLYGFSRINVMFGFQYSPNPTRIDSNALIEFNNGVLNWKYSLNGTTIQNSLNDISTRNLYYYGSLNFASDPRVKENIQDANLELCYETIRNVPLRKFKYIDSYCSTFQVRDTHRLGFLATELREAFPKSVHESDTVFPAFSTSLLTIDTAQIEMAHLGATKYLMQKVSTLEAEVKALL